MRPRRQTQGRADRFLGLRSAHSRAAAAVGRRRGRCRREWPRAFEIMRDGPIGAAAFNNEFGRPCLGGYFRTFETETAGASDLRRGYDKPIMIAGGLASIRPGHVHKSAVQPGDAVIVLGGPAMLIGLGGGAASSVAAARAPVPSWNSPRCSATTPKWSAAASKSSTIVARTATTIPIVSIHDVGAGGLSNAIPELLNDADVGGRIDLRKIPSDDPQLSPMQMWSNESQERYVLAMRADDLAAFRPSAERERCPVRGGRRSHRCERQLTRDRSATATSTVRSICRWIVLFGKPPRMHRDARRATKPLHRSVPDLSGIGMDEAIDSRAAAAYRRQQELSDHHRRPHRRRAQPSRSDGRPVAGPGGRLCRDPRRFRRLRRRGDGDGRARTGGLAQQCRLGADGGGRGDYQSGRRRHRRHWPDPPVGQLDGARSIIRARTPRCSMRSRRWAWSCVRRWILPFRSARTRMSMQTEWHDGEIEQRTVSPVSLVITGFATGQRRAAHADAATAAGSRRFRPVAGRPGCRDGSPRRIGADPGVQSQRRRAAGSGRCPDASRAVRSGAGSPRRRPAAGLSRPFRWRCHRYPAGDGLCRPLRSGDSSGRLGRSDLARRIQRGTGCGDAGAPRPIAKRSRPCWSSTAWRR